jgi:hypothetical protein
MTGRERQELRRSRRRRLAGPGPRVRLTDDELLAKTAHVAPYVRLRATRLLFDAVTLIVDYNRGRRLLDNHERLVNLACSRRHG